MYKTFADPAGQAPARARLLKQRRDDLVVLCIRSRHLCAEALQVLKPEHFSLGDEKAHRVIIRHLWALLAGPDFRPGTVPRAALYDAITTELVSLREEELAEPWVGEILDDPDEPGGGAAVPGLLARGYAAGPAPCDDDKYALDTLRKFLEERAVADRVVELAGLTGTSVPVGYTDKVADVLTMARRIEAIGASPFAAPMPDDWAPEPMTVFPTGCLWIDNLLGGQVAGDVNGIIGPFGGGKTTSLVQIAVGSANYFIESAGAAATKPKLALMVSYEEKTSQVRPRVMSCAARISKRGLEQLRSLDELSRTGALKDYELAMYRAEGEEDYSRLPGEYERLQSHMARMNRSLKMVNMREDGRGYGWVDELAAQIDRFRHENEAEIGVVCLDYVNAMCRRYLEASGKNLDRELRHMVQRTPLAMEEKIGTRFGCAVWLAQQFSGDANKKAPTAKMLLADAGECKTFGENLVFCVGLGNKQANTHVLQAHVIKGRRDGVDGNVALLQLQGDLGRFVAADDRFTVENNKIVDRAVAAKFNGPVLPAPAVQQYVTVNTGMAGW